MAFKLIVDNQTYIGYTIPGTSPMRIAHESSKQFSDPFIADFIPGEDLLGKKPTGRWVSIQPGTDQELLEKLKPEVLAACRRRRLSILKSNLGLPPGYQPQGLPRTDDINSSYEKHYLALLRAKVDRLARIIES